MSNDKILKKSVFGGFKKSDVLDYIEKLQQENVELRRSNEEKENILAALNEAYNTCNTLKEEKSSLELAKEDLLKKVNDLTEKNIGLTDALGEAREKLDAASSESAVSPDERNSAVIRDAVKYADSIVDAAKRDAADILLAAKSSIDSAASDIVSAQERANTARSNLDYSLVSVGESIRAVLNSLGNLTDELSGENNG